MKIVYPICCGVDVHKTFLVATIITSQGLIPHYSKKRFSTFNNSILKFKQWLITTTALMCVWNLPESIVRTASACNKLSASRIEHRYS